MRRMKTRSKQILAAVLSAGMVVSALPPGITFAATAETIYGAAYQGAQKLAETTLPQTISMDGIATEVTWDFNALGKANTYDTVEVTGTAGTSKVQAQVEVLPEQENSLIYFVDASREGKESKAFDAVSGLAKDTLKNATADQVKSGDATWGRVGTNFKEKSVSNVDQTKKIQTGWYSSSKTASLNYEFDLEPGTYTLNAGFYEWWNGRSMKIMLSGSGMDSVTSQTATVSGIGDSKVIGTAFTVKEEGTVKMEVQNATGGEAPVISWFAVAKGAMDSETDATEITVKGSDVDTAAKNVNGLTWKGFGLLSGNSTSNLLLDYKSQSPEVYQELLEQLFGGTHPLMNHVKIEMGNDGNNSTGSDACTMRSETEEADASRSPGFVLAADAKKVNPDIKVSILRWSMPSWVANAWSKDKTGAGYEAVYKWYKETVFDAYEKYGYVLDYINPDKNETTSPDKEFIKWYKNRMSNETEFPSYMDEKAQEAYKNIKIIASDENTSLNIVPNMRSDSALYNAVDAIGFHYSAGSTSSTADYRKMADTDDKEVWYSEGCATFSYTEYQENKTTAYGANTIGGYQSPLALADNFIKSFVYARKTHYIFQPAVGSFYEGAQYDHKELLSAREPWAGYVHYDPMIYLLEHYTKFAKTGWENEDNTAGIWRVIAAASGNNSTGSDHLKNEAGEPSYMTLASPDKKDFSVVIVNNSDQTLSYKIKAEDMQLENTSSMELWETKTDSYMQRKGTIPCKNGSYSVTVQPFSMVTVTTLNCEGEEYGERLPEETEKTVLDTEATGKSQDTTDAILYADDYEYAGYDNDYLASRGNEPRYTVDLSGAFTCEDGVLKQVLNHSVGEWNSNKPNCTVGDFRWMNYKASVDVVIPEDGFAGINIRQQTGMNFEGSGYNLQITREGSWSLKKHGTVLANGEVAQNKNGTYTLALEGKGAIITAWIDGKEVTCYNDPNPEYFGRVRLGCDWKETSFDNLVVEKVAGHTAYATELVDNASDEVSYENGQWDIIAGAGGGSNDWYRSTSTSKASGATFSFDMKGTGFALIGKNDGTAKLQVTVDGTVVAAEADTYASNNHYSTYQLNHLPEGIHKVTVAVTKGTLVLDAIVFFAEGATDKTELSALIKEAEGLNQGAYMEESWTTMQTALEAAKKVVDNKEVQQEEADQAWYTLKSAITGLLQGDTVVDVEKIAIAAYAGKEANLPSTIKYTLANGTTRQAEVTWEQVPEGKAYEKVTVNGQVTEDGRKVSATVELVPEHMVWFIDSGIDVATQTSTAPFEMVKALVGVGAKLQNDKADQVYEEGTTTWGYTASDVGLKSQSNIDMTDKTASGIYALGNGSTARPITYTLPMKAGTYTVTAGFEEWWGMNRYMDLQAVWTDSLGEHKETLGSTVSLSSSNVTGMTAGTITVKEDATVQIKVVMASGTEAPVISWLGVNRIVTDTTALVQEITEAESIDTIGYTKESVQILTDAIASAKAVAANEEVTEEEVEAARKELQQAVEGLVIVIPDPEPVKVTEVNVNKTAATLLAVGGKEQLVATVLPENAENKKVTWTSTNTKVATVSSTGLVTAKAVGSANIIVTSTDGTEKTAVCKITVTQPVTKVVVNGPLKVTIVKGNTKTLSASVSPANTTMSKTLKWTTSNKKVATVDNKGKVTAKKEGTAVITITAVNGVKATVKVTVKAPKKVNYLVTAGTNYKLSWTKQKTAAGYRIYCSKDGKAYKQFAEVTGAKTTKYETVLSIGHSYKFKVRPFEYKNGSQVLGKEQKVTKSTKKNSVEASYTNLSGYEGYRIQMRTKTKKGYSSWKTVKTSTDTESGRMDYIFTGTNKKTSYEFRIQGTYHKNGKKVVKTLSVKKVK